MSADGGGKSASGSLVATSMRNMEGMISGKEVPVNCALFKAADSRPTLKTIGTAAVTLATFIVICFAAVGIAAAQGYTITDLGTLGGDFSAAHGINNAGQVVGGAAVPDGRERAFIWQEGVMQEVFFNFAPFTIATGINGLGQVVGYGFTVDREHDLAFLWLNGVAQSLGTLPNSAYSNANAINDLGQVVGSSGERRPCRNRPPPHAFLWQNGLMQDLGTLPGSVGNCFSLTPSSSANGINNSGQVVGSSRSDNFGEHAFLWQNGLMQDLGPGTATAINNSGQVVGSSGGHAFLWQGGMMEDLGALSGDGWSSALGINGPGQVVGWSGNSGFPQRAFLWQSGVMQDLNNLIPPGSGWTLTQARSINDAGQIVGSGTLNGQTRAFLLTPEASSTEPRIEQDDPSVSYAGTWYSNAHSLHSGGSAVLSMEAGARATVSFIGTGISWIGYRDEWSGIARVYIDGVFVSEVDTYLGAGGPQAVLYSTSGLSNAAHTLTIEVTGTKNPAASGLWIWVDAFDIATDSSPPPPPAPSGGRVEESDQAADYTGAWYSNAHSVHSGGSAVLSMEAGARATVSFTGSGVSWIGYQDQWSGIARVFIDGALVAEVDTYGDPGGAQAVLYSTSGLSRAAHTLTIEVTGTKNPAASGLWIWVDAFDIAP